MTRFWVYRRRGRGIESACSCSFRSADQPNRPQSAQRRHRGHGPGDAEWQLKQNVEGEVEKQSSNSGRIGSEPQRTWRIEGDGWCAGRWLKGDGSACHELRLKRGSRQGGLAEGSGLLFEPTPFSRGCLGEASLPQTRNRIQKASSSRPDASLASTIVLEPKFMKRWRLKPR